MNRSDWESFARALGTSALLGLVVGLGVGCNSGACSGSDSACQLSHIQASVNGTALLPTSIAPHTVQASQLTSAPQNVPDFLSPPQNTVRLTFSNATDPVYFLIETASPSTGNPEAVALDVLVDAHVLGQDPGDLGQTSGESLPLVAFQIPVLDGGQGTMGLTMGFTSSSSLAVDFTPMTASGGGDAITALRGGGPVSLGPAMSVAVQFAQASSGGETGGQICGARGALYCQAVDGPQDPELQMNGGQGDCITGCAGSVGYECVFADASQGSPACFADTPSARAACPNAVSIVRCTNN